MRLRLLLSALVVLAGLVAVSEAIAGSAPVRRGRASLALYVDQGSVGGRCSDSTTAAANSITRPWCTITHAFAAAAAGTTVYVRRGMYPPVTVTSFAPRSMVTFEAYPGETAAVAGFALGTVGVASQNFTIRGLNIGSGAIKLTDVSNAVVSANTITVTSAVSKCSGGACAANTRTAITLTPPMQNVSIINNDIPVGAVGVLFRLGAPPSSPGHPLVNTYQGINVSGNTFAHMGNYVISAQNFEGLTIDGNTFANDHAYGNINPSCHCEAVHLIGGGDNVTLNGNLVYGGRGFLVQPGRSTGASSNSMNCKPVCLTMTNVGIYNNTFVGRDFGIRVLSAPGIRIRNNTIEGPPGPNAGLSFISTHPQSTNVVVTNNLISYFGSSVGTTFASEGYNDVSVRATGGSYNTPTSAHDISGTPSYVSPGSPRYDYALTPGSPGRGAGSASLAAPLDPGYVARSPVSMGAFGAEYCPAGRTCSLGGGAAPRSG